MDFKNLIWLLSFIPNKLFADQAERLEHAFSDEELHKALLSLALDATPCPDGINLTFFKHFWPLLGKDIARFWNLTLDLGQAPKYLMDAVMVLIPKVVHPSLFSDWRLYLFSMYCIKLVLKLWHSG